VVNPPLGVSVILALGAIGAGSWVLARATAGPLEASEISDLLLWRLAITAALVIALTAAAHGLSAHLAGLLAPFPIITAVLAGFTHARVGADAAIELLSGLVRALVCFLAFFATLAEALAALSGPGAFGLATAAALTLWAAVIAASRASRPSRRS